MNARAELIKWWDALDALTGRLGKRDAAKGLKLARDSEHADAKWLASLFPANEPVTEQGILDVMEAQGDDPRALYLRGELSNHPEWVQQAAEKGFAPAQVSWDVRSNANDAEKRAWALKAAAQGDRVGISVLAHYEWEGSGCEEDRAKAVVLWKEAAGLGEAMAMYALALLAFEDCDWERYHWLARSAKWGNTTALWTLQRAADQYVKAFKEGNSSSRRVVFELGSVLRAHFDVDNGTIITKGVLLDLSDARVEAAQRCVELYEAWSKVPKAAIECWIGVGLRFGVVKDIRFVIARMLWEQRRDWIQD